MDDDDDPPLGACPPWCEQPKGHPWEDEWGQGPIRFHNWTRELNKWHAIGVESTEQYRDGSVYHTTVKLDVESPTVWDVETAAAASLILAEAIDYATRWRKTVGDVGEM